MKHELETMEIPINFDLSEPTLGRLEELSPNDPDSKDCRICLESDSQLIRACRCRGTVGHVHEHCLREWIERKAKVPAQGRKPIECEICHCPFNYERRVFRSCEWEHFLEEFRRERAKMGGLVLLYCLVLGGSIFFAWLLGESQLAEVLYFSGLMRLLSACLLVLLFLLLTIAAIYFLRHYCVTRRTEIVVEPLDCNRMRMLRVVVKSR
jgi:hypothetical protein